MQSHLAHRDGMATLVMFAHPRCACTRAELRELVGRHAGHVDVYVVFLQPNETWSHTGIWNDATSIETVNVLDDTEGAEAERFGAMTSGHVVLYDSHGALAFAGGITSARGHVGDNAGARTLDALLDESRAHELAQATVGPVYGCRIQGGGR